MLAAPPHLAQEEWKSDDRDDLRAKRHCNTQSKLHACNKTTLHRRRLSKGRRMRRWCWRGAGPPKENAGPPPSTSDSSSDTDLPRTSTHPSGFENSAMKSSFSLSSLPPSTASLEGKEHAADRPFFSLRKKPRRDEVRVEVRRSWGKDEFWAALENNYLYLMDRNLIDTCKEADQEAEDDGCPSVEWRFSQFTEQFSKLNSWLENIQNAADTRSKSLYEEMQRNAYKRKVFNNQSGRLVARSPELKEEIAWRVSYLNSKWERLEHLTLRTRAINRPELPTDIEHELRCLRKFIKETEKRLPPLDFKTNWSVLQLEDLAKEMKVVQNDVWLHGRAVRRVVKLCEDYGGDGGSLTSWVRGRRLEPSQAATYARGLERRWESLYISSLEWQCHIENRTKTARLQEAENPKLAEPESDEEPVSKHPRLTDPPVVEQEDEVDLQVWMDTSEGECEDMEVEQRSLDVVDEEVPSETNQDNLTILLGQSLHPSVVRRLFLDEAAKFNRSDRNGPNCATFYFKHLDTESEAELGTVEGAVSVEGGAKSTIEESSEEEWTYTVTQDSGTATVELEEANLEAAMMASLGGLEDLPDDDKSRPRKEMIAKLVEKAEEMILEEVSASPARKRASRVFEPHRIIDPHTNTKYTRVKEWLQLHPDSKVVGDSCDASGETTEEEGSSEDCSDQLDLTLKPSETESEPRVVLRHKRPSGPRPSSFSSPSALLPSPCLPHSISESAIYQLTQTGGSNGQMGSSANNVSTLSSSTVEESTLTQDCGSAGGYSSNSLRHRKVKLRKRSLMRKSESCGSEGVLGASDATLASPIKLPTLAKLAMRRASGEKPSDSARKCVHTVLSGNLSATDSESEGDGSIKHQKVSGVAPSFRLGPAHTLCSYASDRKDGKIVSADSSFSETAWDNYQEKYMSEAYSEEAPDSEAARRILDFGDDYQTFLDSQSDCASSLGHPQLLMRKPARRQTRGGESDSELEDVWHLVRQSQSQLFFSEKVLKTLLSRASRHLVLASDFAELETTCNKNMSVLTQMLEKIEESNDLLSAEECNDIRELIRQWERLEKGAEKLQRERSLKRDMAALREELLEMAARSVALQTNLNDRDQLELRIQELKGELSRLRDVNKSQLFQVNVAVHRFITDCPSSNSALKEQVAELYRLWDDTFHRASGVLRSLEEAETAWLQVERHLTALQSALLGDQEALSLFKDALSKGSVPPEMASELRDIARILSEKSPGQEPAVRSDSDHSTLDPATAIKGSAEGSLSDSGISDSCWEQELSERERRLSAIRRLVRRLETVLAPNSQEMANMAKRLMAVEVELKGLQQTCRELIIKAAVSIDAKGRLPSPVSDSSSPKNEKEASSGRRWLARVLRTSTFFQLAFVVLFCIGYLLQPQCCDYMNNLDFTLTPRLRYFNGPPPV